MRPHLPGLESATTAPSTHSPAPAAPARPRRGPRAWQLGAVALVVVLVAELLARAVGGHLPPLLTGDGYEMEIKYEQLSELADGPAAQQPQVIFLGNSMTDAGVSPEVFATASTTYESAYNAALIGAPVDSQPRWAGDFVLDGLDPKLVVIGISPLDLLDVNPLDLLDVTQGQGRSQAVQDAFDATLDQVRPTASQRLEERAEKLSALVRYRSSLRDPRMLGRAVGDTLTGKAPRKGIPQVATVEGDRVVPRDAAFWRSALRPTGGTGQFHERRLDQQRDPDLERRLADAMARADFRPERLTRVLRALRDDGRRVVVLIPPVAAQVLASVPGAVDRYRLGADLIATLAARFGVKVVDFASTDYPLRFFADVAHLNGPGSDRFSRDLGHAVDAL